MKKLMTLAENQTFVVVFVATFVTAFAFYVSSSVFEFLANYFAGATTTAAIAWLIETADDEQEQGGTFHDKN